LFLSKAERDFLLQRQEINKNQQRYIRYKLRRKIKHFYNNELPLLIEHGYIVAGGAANDCGVAASTHSADSRATVSPQTSDKLVNDEAILAKRSKRTGPRGFDPLTCGSEDRRDIRTTLRAQQAC
jgi:hypothetical protein